MDFVPGSYAQIKIPTFSIDYDKDAEITQLFYAMSEKLYSSKDGQSAPNAGPSEAANADDVYDADYKVVDDDNA